MPPAEQPKKKRSRVAFEQPPAAVALPHTAQSALPVDDAYDDGQERLLPGRPCIDAKAVRAGRKELWLIQLPPGIALERLAGQSVRLDLNSPLQEVQVQDPVTGQPYTLNQDASSLAHNLRMMTSLASVPSATSSKAPAFGLLPISRRFSLAKDPAAALALLLPSGASSVPQPVTAHDTYIADDSPFNPADDPTTWRPPAAAVEAVQRLRDEQAAGGPAAGAAGTGKSGSAAPAAAAPTAAPAVSAPVTGSKAAAADSKRAATGSVPDREKEVSTKKRKKSKAWEDVARSVVADNAAVASLMPIAEEPPAVKSAKKSKKQTGDVGSQLAFPAQAQTQPQAGSEDPVATEHSSKKEKKKNKDKGAAADQVASSGLKASAAFVPTGNTEANVSAGKGAVADAGKVKVRHSLGGSLAAVDETASDVAEPGEKAKKKKKRRHSEGVVQA